MHLQLALVWADQFAERVPIASPGPVEQADCHGGSFPRQATRTQTRRCLPERQVTKRCKRNGARRCPRTCSPSDPQITTLLVAAPSRNGPAGSLSSVPG